VIKHKLESNEKELPEEEVELIGNTDKEEIPETKVIIEDPDFTKEEQEEAIKWWNELNEGWKYIFKVSLILEGIDSAFDEIPLNTLYHVINNLKEVIIARKDVASLEGLTKVKHVKKLLINSSAIKNLEPTYHLKLEELEIRKSSISPEQLILFQSNNPNCKIKAIKKK
jgi:hypothetical protein